MLTVCDLLQVTGGGGYTKENVARCWALETGVLLDSELPNGMMSTLLFLCGAFALPLMPVSVISRDCQWRSQDPNAKGR